MKMSRRELGGYICALVAVGVAKKLPLPFELPEAQAAVGVGVPSGYDFFVSIYENGGWRVLQRGDEYVIDDHGSVFSLTFVPSAVFIDGHRPVRVTRRCEHKVVGNVCERVDRVAGIDIDDRGITVQSDHTTYFEFTTPKDGEPGMVVSLHMPVPGGG